MTSRKRIRSQVAICINPCEYPASLELHKVYRVLPDPEAEREGDLRIIDESGEDYLYPAACFVLVGLPLDQGRTLTKSYVGEA